MHVADLIGPAIPDPELLPCKVVQGICAVTGQEAECLPRKIAFAGVRLSLDFLRAPSSQFVSVGIFLAMSYKWTRFSSWICDTHGFRRLNKKDIRDVLIAGKYSAPWGGYVTTSFQKHGSLVTPVNNTSSQAVWRFEDENIDCTNHNKLITLWNGLIYWMQLGLHSTVLTTLQPTNLDFTKISINRFLEFEAWARPFYHSGLYRFLTYLLPSRAELKNA